jgi:hypothetical protein
MSKNSSKLIQSPAKCVHSKANFKKGYLVLSFLYHDTDVESEKNRKLDGLEEASRPGNNKTILVQQRRFTGVVEGDWLLLVMIGDDVPKGRRGVNNATLIDGAHHLLARGRAEEVFALSQDGHLERRQSAPGPRRVPGSLFTDLGGRILERLETSHEDMREEEETLASLIVLVKAPKNSCRDELAERGSRPIDILPIGQTSLFFQKLGSVDQQTVNWSMSGQ